MQVKIACIDCIGFSAVMTISVYTTVSYNNSSVAASTFFLIYS